MFFVFRDSYVLNILCTFRISVSSVWYNRRNFFNDRQNQKPLCISRYALSSGGCWICRLHLCRGVRPLPTNVLSITIDWILWRGSCLGDLAYMEPFHCYYSPVNSDPISALSLGYIELLKNLPWIIIIICYQKTSCYVLRIELWQSNQSGISLYRRHLCKQWLSENDSKRLTWVDNWKKW